MAEDKIPIRNIILLGHSQAGKTQLSEALLYKGGTIPKMGNVDEGNTVSDYNEDEIERKISINSSILNFNMGKVKINMVDAPGYGDFIGEVLSGMNAVDCAIIVVNAVNGIEIGTDRALKLVEAHKLPLIIFINRIDKEHADFNKCVGALENLLGKKAIVLTYPIGKEASFKDIANLVTKEKIDQIPADDRARAEKLSESFIENVAECDDALLEKYLDKGELSRDEIKPVLKKGIHENRIIPIMAGASVLGIGIKKLLHCVFENMPSPAEMPPR